LALNGNRTLLAVTAHPDDETFGMGGTLALYAQRDVAVHLICATRGESGDVAPEYLQGYEDIADLRMAELNCAAENLGLAQVHMLNYRDSGMTGSPQNGHPNALASAPVDETAARIARTIRILKPEVVLTFDPIGGYKHPDHIAVHNATVQAFHQAADPGIEFDGAPPYQVQKLYFQTIPRTFLRWAVRLLPLFGKDPTRWGHNHDINLIDIARVDFPIHAAIDYRSVHERKEAATACHASQGGSNMAGGLMGWFMRLAVGKDTYMRAYPEPDPGLKEHDLFEGVT
jgi:N-acetyl-1-D-myo-inositol-2-amino-2-deoxy-alpha-D-glucopyranoside deacetylase